MGRLDDMDHSISYFPKKYANIFPHLLKITSLLINCEVFFAMSLCHMLSISPGYRKCVVTHIYFSSNPRLYVEKGLPHTASIFYLEGSF